MESFISNVKASVVFNIVKLLAVVTSIVTFAIIAVDAKKQNTKPRSLNLTMFQKVLSSCFSLETFTTESVDFDILRFLLASGIKLKKMKTEINLV